MTAPEPAVAGALPERALVAWPSLRRWLGPTLALLALLLALDQGVLPRAPAQRASDVLQLALALVAGAACVHAALRERSLGRAFWSLIALGVLIWALGQLVWTLESVAFHPFTTISMADLLFLTCSTPFMIVPLVRPDRPRSTTVGLAFDASLLLVLLVYADAYFVFGELVAGEAAAFQAWQTRILGARGIMVLVVFLWLVRTSRLPWRPLFGELGLALGVLYGMGAVANVFLAQGTYRPGLHDLGWTLPFLWIGLTAARWTAVSPPPPSTPARAVPDWRDTRRGTVLAIVVAILVPTVHLISTSMGEPNPPLQELRGTITLVTIVMVGALFLVRQLRLLKQVEANQAQREATLRSSEERFQKAFRASPAAMSISTFPEGRLIDVNDRYVELTGYSREELLSRTVAELGLWVDAAEHEALVRSVRERGTPRGTELQYRRQSGEIRTARTSYELVEVAGEGCLLGLSEDVSERRSLEAQLRQAQKMEAVGRLAGGVAHDFNNLLTAILGYAGLMLRRMGPDDPWRKNAQEIQKAGNRAAELVRQLLAFSRKQVLIPQVIDLRLVVTETETMLRRLIGEHIELVTSTPSDLGAVRVDGGQVNQVILNLVLNARDAMPRGGRLTISLGNAELGEAFIREHPGAKGGPHVVLSVSDTGVGMSPETQSHIFEPFYTTKEVGKGTGLGLATVYGIVKQSDGYIAVTSAPGQGSTFDVYLPRVAGPPERPRAERTSSAPRGTETILLVEDEEAVRGLVHEILESAGYRVLAASNGADALHQSRKHEGPIQLMITDVVMPGMSGLQLARQISAARPDLRILYTSGHADDALGPLGLREPGRSFLHKPLTPDDLVGRVREVLDGPAPEMAFPAPGRG